MSYHGPRVYEHLTQKKGDNILFVSGGAKSNPKSELEIEYSKHFQPQQSIRFYLRCAADW